MPCPLHSAALAYNGGPAERAFVWMLILLASQVVGQAITFVRKKTPTCLVAMKFPKK